MIRTITNAWRKPTGDEALRRRWAGQIGTEVDFLAVRMGRSPGPAEVRHRMGENSRRLMERLGLKVPQTTRAGALLAEIDRSCKVCRDWRLCTRWLESSRDSEAYRGFCPNVARWDELA
jgi:hypothetical protein